MELQDDVHISPDNLYRIPAGKYIVFTLQIKNEKADFSPLLDWISKREEKIDAVFAEEVGLQLFPYLENYYCEVKARLKN